MDKLPPQARALIDAALHADDPTPAERERADVAARSTLAVYGVVGLCPLEPANPAPPLLPAPAGGLPVTAAKTATLVKLGLGLGGLFVVAAGLFGVRVLWQPGSSGPQPPAASASAPAAAAATPAPVLAPPAPAAASEQPRAPSAPLPAATEDPRSALQPAGRARPASKHHHAARAPGAADQRASDAALERELKLLAAANDMLRRARYSEALRLLDSAREAAPTALREERSALRILALCGQAPDAAALREREQFLRAAPQSVLAERVRAACAPSEGQ